MKNKKSIMMIFVLIVIIIGIIIKNACDNNEEFDENMLYKIEFGNTILKFERIDDSLGQNQIVGVEKSTDKGKTFTRITENPITVSLEPQFKFLNENLGFAVQRGYLWQSSGTYNNGLLVTEDGGKTFSQAVFNYDNENVDTITITKLPYYDGNQLKMECSVYQINATKDGYEDILILFVSKDNGKTWVLDEITK